MPDEKKNLPAKGDHKPAVKGKKNKKERRSIARFFRDTIAELKKVTWPTRKELTTYTLVVLGFVIIISVMVGTVDLGLGSLYKLAFGG